jgi:uncharacterized protein with HEPN domain/predicted nucleotidyltransferase
MTSQFPTAVKERLQASPSQIADFCQRWNIIELALFGSILRDDFRPDSDIDILASFARNTSWNIFDFIQMQEQLETMLGRDVDLTQKQQINNPFSRSQILATCHIIYSENRTISSLYLAIKPANLLMQADNRNQAALWDMVEAIKQIIEFTANSSCAEYRGNRMVQRAVERELEILGEAARRISEEFHQANADIDWRNMINLRNLIAHRYDRVEPDTLWNIIITVLPGLLSQLELLLPPLPPDVEPVN